MGDPHCDFYPVGRVDADGQKWRYRCMGYEQDHPTEAELREMHGK